MNQRTAVSRTAIAQAPSSLPKPKARRTSPATRPQSTPAPEPVAETTPKPSTPSQSPAELEFMKAMQEYKQSSGRMFPTWSEVLEVLKTLGYAKPE